MLLQSAQVENYRSIVDSGTVLFDPEITCIVGKVGSGKTSFLRMLEGVSRRVWFKESELPRSSAALRDFRSGRAAADQIVQLSAAFDVEDEDRPILPRQYRHIDSVSIRRTFGGRIDVYADGEPAERAPAGPEAERRLAEMLRRLDAGVEAAISDVHARHPDMAGAYEENLREAVRELGAAGIRDRRGLETAVGSLRNAARALPLYTGTDRAVGDALAAMSRLAEEVATRSKNDPVELLYEQVPKPLYMEGAFELDDKVAIDSLAAGTGAPRTFRCISAICGLTAAGMQRMRSASPPERAAYLEAKSSMLSDSLNSFWRQEEYGFELAIDGGLLRLRVSDGATGTTTLASERSGGFKWWLAFFLEVSALLAGGGGRRILLLDNPATEIHDEGKGDVLRFVRAAAESGRLQVVYSTHGRALVDPWRVDRVRIAELGKGGTRINAVPAKSRGAQLEAIMRNVGSPARYSLFGAPRMVCFEGPSDTYIASAVNEYLAEVGAGGHLDRDTYSINTFGGIDAAAQACRLYGDLGLEFVLVVDSGAETESTRKRLGGECAPRERIVEMRQAIGMDGGTEDAVDREAYYEAFKLAYGATLADLLPTVDEIDGNPRRKRAANYAEWFEGNGKGAFEKTLVAQQMFGVMMGRGRGGDPGRAAALDRTAGNFARLFGLIAGKLDAGQAP